MSLSSPRTLFSASALLRAGGVLVVLCVLWLTVLWAVALP
jgi:hypothetical protein